MNNVTEDVKERKSPFEGGCVSSCAGRGMFNLKFNI